MATTKQCKECGKAKDITQFSKRKASKDGLQPKCRECNKKDNHKFRTEINPKHHYKWQKEHYDWHIENMRKYRKADDTPKIYYIQNPVGEMYIGMTEMYLSVRTMEHRAHYRRALKGKRARLPGLHDSFDKYGLENHKFGIAAEFEGIDRKQLRMIEKSFIDAVRTMGKSLNAR